MFSDRSGIEIDYCPTCRGVRLDCGERDKIIKCSEAAASAPEYASWRGQGCRGYKKSRKRKSG
ncbi:zf-TFIIB domain-containing protein [Yoonia sp.]|uniref:TFIIB-type zinc ribbon-containing protein n=1 Tax=Yoonia sp. TaxID=2212373 RepID=UPI00289ED48A|nr:zf-TFIIB domain-containing protein [Yoonia sp.]